jgi:hypothetical protein
MKDNLQKDFYTDSTKVEGWSLKAEEFPRMTDRNPGSDPAASGVGIANENGLFRVVDLVWIQFRGRAFFEANNRLEILIGRGKPFAGPGLYSQKSRSIRTLLEVCSRWLRVGAVSFQLRVMPGLEST